MKQGDIGWSEKRRFSSRVLAYYFESHGREWTSIREAAHVLAVEFGILTAKKRRSQVAIECSDAIERLGLLPPPTYLPPWARNGASPILNKRKKPVKNEILAAFYDSFDWKQLRYQVLAERGRRCECCGADYRATMIHVDRIKSVRKNWHRRLDPDNLQVLCEGCNRGKGFRDETDFKTKKAS